MINYLLVGLFGIFGGWVTMVCFLLAISPWVKRKKPKKGANSIQDVGEKVNAIIKDKEGVKHHVN